MVMWGHPEALKEMAKKKMADICNLGGEYVELEVVQLSA
jgi:hypothetical protein